MSNHFILLLLSALSLSFFHVSVAVATRGRGKEILQRPGIESNPFTPRASLNRYWNIHVSNKLPIPHFFLSKASPLSPHDYAFLTKLVARKSLSSTSNWSLESFCSLANLHCFFDSSTSYPNALVNRTNGDANFALYTDKHFTNYGSSRIGSVDSFKNYSEGINTPNDSFKKYSQASIRHGEQFANYAENGNVADTNFTSYASRAKQGSGNFNNYDKTVNVPNLQFASYDSSANSHDLSFSSYGNDTNSGTQSFVSYSKNVNVGHTEFSNYADSSNILQSDFTGYGESGHGANDSFKAYSFSGNNPHANFKNYGTGANSGTDTFMSYRNRANVGEDNFQTYARNSKSGSASFANYGQSFNVGNDTFKDYGKGSAGGTTIGFKSYGLGRTFKDYNKQVVSFSEYNNFSGQNRDGQGKIANRWVEPGKFFRESILKAGNVMAMPDIRDKMPSRSFLPGTISSKLPFSSSQLSQIKEMFRARENSATEHVIANALAECERAPSRGETKRCVGSAEEMIQFAVSVLGPNVVVRTIENAKGSSKSVMIGRVKTINGGKVTKSVSCHQSLYPYLLYYCHSVPKVRVYEADILDVDTKRKINHGVAICHLDTSAWGPEHGAFIALGSTPGKIEVCHWIFENDMTWTSAE
ncbi:hypothetical protein L6164_014697 [Bauhinia variegata]|uniref:Uncharacterized protein n=1 Tax=Bauhinia variegata TaxID=167791 RepID=A0ACB9NJV8_BAUVA|nr:hypothetical protein L6164_014697 [Bauhinia variegata]